MPSLRMKSQSTKGCLKDKNGLPVCQKSSMISKSLLSRDRTMQNVEAVETLIQSSQDASLWKKQCTRYSVNDETNNGESLDADELVLQKEESPSSFLAANRMELASATCSSSIGTTTAPDQEFVDFSTETYVYSDGGLIELNVPPLETDDSDDSSGGSCKYETCRALDFYYSDMLVSDLPVEGSSIYDDSIDTKFFHDYRCDDEPTMYFDMAKEYTVMPFLEDAMNNGYTQDNVETMINSADTSLHQVIHQVRSCNQESNVGNNLDSNQAESFDPQIFISNIPDLTVVASDLRPTSVASETQKSRSITLVLDLDETLVHSTLEPCDDADFTFSVFFDMKDHTVYVKQRPHLHTFLQRVAEMFEIVIFTASQSIYAKQLLDVLDPDGKLISHRAYREACTFSDGSYTKDLTILGVDLAKVAIIDNSPQVFRLQVNNGIPIESWFDDPLDCELLALLPFLEKLADADDVRPIIAEKFGNKERDILVSP